MNEKPQIVIGALFGSASFITQLIIGSIFALVSFRIEILPYLRDCFCYLLLIVWIFYIFIIKKQIQPIDAYGFLVFYLVYILFAFLTPRDRRLKEEDELNDEIAFELSTIEHSLNITPIDEDKDLNKGQRVWKIFFSILSPIDGQEWANSNRIQKSILIIKLPILFLVQLTSPLIDVQPLEKLTLERRFKMFIQMILGPQLILEAISCELHSYVFNPQPLKSYFIFK